MGLKDFSFKISYNKVEHDIAKEFYLPCMQNSIRYDRATGYFGSSIYLLSWTSLKVFIENGGIIRLICSPYLVPKDIDAIDEGHKALNSSIQQQNLFKEFEKIFSKSTLTAPERVLACLIAKEQLCVKIAVGKYDPSRLFHDKAGIFTDSDNNSVAFRGSVNETFKGMSDDGNFEALEVFESWRDKSDKERVDNIQNHFEMIWNNKAEKIIALDLPDNIQTLIKKHAQQETNWQNAYDEIITSIDESVEWSADKRKNGKRPRKHQLDALKAWEDNGRRGIFEHATGSGKTFSAMCAIRKCMEEGSPVIVLVPSVGLLDQWHQELSEIFHDLDIQYLLCGGGNSEWKDPYTLNAFTSTSIDDYRITIAVMDTASTPEFYSQVISSNKLLIVADEAHRVGSESRRAVFKINAGYRLGLSATPIRYGDPEGTKAIFDYFGGIVGEPYTLKNAIEDNVLCHYFYFPHVVQLQEDEQKLWDEVSSEISAIVARHIGEESSVLFSNGRLKHLLIKRARIIKNARTKIQLAHDVLCSNYKNGDRWIVYCDNMEQLRLVLNDLSNSGLRAYEYHSQLTKEVKDKTLEYFSSIGGIVVSIKCLDEGIDIPNTTHALILASSQNPREFVQRRGRILRKSNNKNFAYLHDAIVIPNHFERSDRSTKIIENELVRCIQFGEWSEDSKCIVDLKLLAIQNDIDFNNISNTGLSYE